MNFLNIKSWISILFTLFIVSIFLTSCQKELSTLPKTEDLNLPSEIHMNSLDSSTDESFEQLELPPERTADNSNPEAISERMQCWNTGAWNYFIQIGWVYIYTDNSVWVFSNKYNMFIRQSTVTDLCDHGLLFENANAICNRYGWFWDNNENDSILWYWNRDYNGWEKINTALCPVFTG